MLYCRVFLRKSAINKMIGLLFFYMLTYISAFHPFYIHKLKMLNKMRHDYASDKVLNCKTCTTAATVATTTTTTKTPAI